MDGKEKKGPNDARRRRLGHMRYVFFLMYKILILLLLLRPTKAHSSQRRPTKTKKGPKRRFWRRLGPRCVFFKNFSVLLTTTAPNDADASFGPFRRFGFHLPPTTTNESRWLVGGFPGLHLASTTTDESSRLVGRVLATSQCLGQAARAWRSRPKHNLKSNLKWWL